MLESLNKQLTRSLTHLKKIQKKLIAAEKLSALGKLTADIAHEIRNPLTAVGGFARRLNKSLPQETKEKKYAKIIVREVARLEKVLMDTLIYSKPAGLKLMRTDIEKPAANAVKLYADIFSEKKIILKEKYEPNLPRPYIDKHHIQQAVDSLIWNAVDAMPGGGGLTIATGKSRRNQITYITVSVTDTGVGIPADIIDSIFEPFFTTKRLGLGTGLGLPTVSRIMTEHCGFVKANSMQEEQGTTFTLYFPCQSEDEDLKAPCWEELSCGIATDPTRHCSAYPFFGRVCWAVAGSFCEGGTKGICASKIYDCTQCAFYQTINMSLPLHSKRVDHG
jgi:signal transduction histidine kinase